jgi:hypothetical protein
MNIADAITKLIVIQKALTISDPSSQTVKKAWNYFPPSSAALPEIPAWTNSWDLLRVERHIGLRIQWYTVHMQFFAGPVEAEAEVFADIATSFMASLVTDLDADVTLGQSVTNHFLRGGSPTLAILERAGKGYIGLDLFLDLEMKDAVTFA